MNDEQQLKKVRGVMHLLGELGVVAECPRLRAALDEVEQELAQQVEKDSPRREVVEESQQLLLDSNWSVQVVWNGVDCYTAEARRGEAVKRAGGCTLSEALGALAENIYPFEWAEKLKAMEQVR